MRPHIRSPKAYSVTAPMRALFFCMGPATAVAACTTSSLQAFFFPFLHRLTSTEIMPTLLASTLGVSSSVNAYFEINRS